MGFSVSPSVLVTETDLTATIPAVSTSIGGFAGKFMWGPVGERILISSENELVEKFSTPNAAMNWEDWMVCKNFLSYSNALYISRAVGAAAKNASDGAVTFHLIKNRDDFDIQAASTFAGGHTFFAKYPGTFGNKIVVHTCDSTAFTGWTYESNFNYAPTGTELAIVVLYDGKIVETFLADETPGSLDGFGKTNFIETVIADQSKYVWIDIDTAIAAGANTFTLANGVDDSPTDAEILTAQDLFANGDEIDINFLFHGGGYTSQSTVVDNILNIAKTRRDVLALVSADSATSVGSATAVADEITFITTLSNLSTYGIAVSNYKYQYDKYNDIYGWVNYTGDVAGLMAYTDQIAEPWYSPAGFNRGQIKNVVKSAYASSQANRDALYQKNINPIASFPGKGTILYGDKTLATTASAFDRINVRRLFIVIEKAIATAANQQLFEINDDFTRNLFRNMVEPYLRDIQGRRGIYDFKVIADRTNNTDQVLSNNEFVSDIYIKPARAINFIYLNFVAVNAGVTFEEILV